MASTNTTRFGLNKPTPGTAEPVNAASNFSSNMDIIDTNLGYFVCTSSTRPPTVSGKVIYETDTNRVLVWNGTAWTGPAQGNQTLDQAPHTASNTSNVTRVNIVPAFNVSNPNATTVTRKYRCSIKYSLSGVSGGELGRIIFNIDAVETVSWQNQIQSAGASGASSWCVETEFTIAGGVTRVIKLDILRIIGGTQCDYTVNSVAVDDIGV
jgi:hypothetical protein